MEWQRKWRHCCVSYKVSPTDGICPLEFGVQNIASVHNGAGPWSGTFWVPGRLRIWNSPRRSSESWFWLGWVLVRELAELLRNKCSSRTTFTWVLVSRWQESVSYRCANLSKTLLAVTQCKRSRLHNFARYTQGRFTPQCGESLVSVLSKPLEKLVRAFIPQRLSQCSTIFSANCNFI